MGSQSPPAKRTDANVGPLSERELIVAFLDYIGLDRAKLQESVKTLTEALHAKETKFFTYQGQVIEEADVIAWAPRIKAAQALLDKFPLHVDRDDVVKRIEVDVNVKRWDEPTPKVIDVQAREVQGDESHVQ